MLVTHIQHELGGFSYPLTLFVRVGLDVPVGKGIPGVVGLVAGDLDLLKTPLRQVDIASTQVAAKHSMPEPHSSGQGADLAPVARRNIVDNLDLPMVLIITDCEVTI